MTFSWLVVLIIYGLSYGFSTIPGLYWLILIPMSIGDSIVYPMTKE